MLVLGRKENQSIIIGDAHTQKTPELLHAMGRCIEKMGGRYITGDVNPAYLQQLELLRNDQALGHHWLRVKLVGRDGNTDAIGAWVEVEADGVVQRRQVMPTRSYLSQVELPVTFGLGKHARVSKVTVHWPDGSVQTVGDIQVDRSYEVVQGTEDDAHSRSDSSEKKIAGRGWGAAG